MAIKNLEKMDIYNPTNYVNNSEPDIDADNLNKTENKLEETVAKANEIIDALKTLISTVQTNSDNTVPSSSLAYAMQQEITKNKEDIATANSNLVDLESSTVVVDYTTAINIATLKTWTESSYAISSPPSGFTFSDIVSITAFAQDGYGDRWLRVTANQRANASGTLSLMGYCINTTGSIPIIIRVIFKK
jgi:hypothetical protein